MQYDYASFDALAAAQNTTTIDAAANPAAANQALAGIFDPGPAPEPPKALSTSWALPVGVEIDGQICRAARVRELNGADEEALAKVGTNPFRYFDEILRQGAVEVENHWVTSKLLRSMAVADRDTLVLGIRIATYGPDYTWEGWVCPECGGVSDLVFHLDEIEITGPENETGEYDVPLRDGALAHLRLPTGEDQAALFADESMTMAQQNSVMIGRCVTHILQPDGRSVPGNPDLGRQLGMADRKRLVTAMNAHTYGPRLDSIELVHEACGKEVQVALAFGALFR